MGAFTSEGSIVGARWTTAAVAAVLLAACGGRGDGVLVKGDVEGLDTLALRGERLIANAGTAAFNVDSLPRMIDTARRGNATRDSATRNSGGKAARSPAVTSGDQDGLLGSAVGNEMSRRAQARGDSMARALAAQLVGSRVGGSRGDTLRGVLAWQGTEPARQVVLRRGTTTVALSGMPTMGLSRLIGTEIVAYGVAVSPRDFVVNEYLVRAANGVPAYDGVLDESGALRLTDGSGIKQVPLPSGLRGLAGTRVWVAVRNGTAVSGGVVSTR